MTKKEFLRKLESKLDFLGEEKLNTILEKYEKIIDEEIKVGNDEKDIIDSLGSVDMIAKLYIHSKKAEKSKSTHSTKGVAAEGSESVTGKIFNNVFKYIDNTFENIDGDLAKRTLLILCFVVVGVLGLTLLRVPFLIIDMTGSAVLDLIFRDFYFYKVVSTFWSFSLSICYTVFMIWLIIKYINQIVGRYTGKQIKSSKRVNSKTETKEHKYESISIKRDTIFDIIYIILKVFIVVLTIPLIMFETALFLTLFLAISLIVNGVTLFGPVIVIVGLIIMIATLLDLIYVSLFKGGIK